MKCVMGKMIMKIVRSKFVHVCCGWDGGQLTSLAIEFDTNKDKI